MNQSESGACDLLEQAIRELNEMNNCNDTQQDTVLIENETPRCGNPRYFPTSSNEM